MCVHNDGADEGSVDRPFACTLHTRTRTRARRGLSHIARATPRHTYTSIRKHGYLSGGGLYACCRCKLAPGYRQRNRTRSHCMNIICIQVGYMAGRAGISWLARINDYMDPTDVGGPATPRSPRLALYPFTPSYPRLLSLPARPRCPLRTLALSQNALVMARPYNLWIPVKIVPKARPLYKPSRDRRPVFNFAHLICAGMQT